MRKLRRWKISSFLWDFLLLTCWGTPLAARRYRRVNAWNEPIKWMWVRAILHNRWWFQGLPFMSYFSQFSFLTSWLCCCVSETSIFIAIIRQYLLTSSALGCGSNRNGTPAYFMDRKSIKLDRGKHKCYRNARGHGSAMKDAVYIPPHTSFHYGSAEHGDGPDLKLYIAIDIASAL